MAGGGGGGWGCGPGEVGGKGGVPTAARPGSFFFLSLALRITYPLHCGDLAETQVLSFLIWKVGAGRKGPGQASPCATGDLTPALHLHSLHSYVPEVLEPVLPEASIQALCLLPSMCTCVCSRARARACTHTHPHMCMALIS